jgi:hypothetical protein
MLSKRVYCLNISLSPTQRLYAYFGATRRLQKRPLKLVDGDTTSLLNGLGEMKWQLDMFAATAIRI